MVTRERLKEFFDEGEAILKEMSDKQKEYYSQYVGADEKGYYNVIRGIDLAIIAFEDYEAIADKRETDEAFNSALPNKKIKRMKKILINRESVLIFYKQTLRDVK